MAPLISVLIPTRGRPEKLAACVAGLARQDLGGASFEVVIGLDGADPASDAAARRAWDDAGGDGDPQRGGGARSLQIITCDRRGYIPVRSDLVEGLRGEIYLALNDDVQPQPGFLAAHAAAHRKCEAAGTRAIIVGNSRFIPAAHPTLLDLLVERTGLLFFWDTMTDALPEADHGFRHAFGLNCSVPLDAVRAAGGIPSVPDTYGYDDIELAYRLGLPVRYCAEARAPHNHPMTAAGILKRDEELGRAAVRYARINPEFIRATLGFDPLDPQMIAFARDSVDHDASVMERASAAFIDLASQPALNAEGTGDNKHLHAMTDLLRPLRRWHFRRGWTAEADRTSAAEVAMTSLRSSSIG